MLHSVAPSAHNAQSRNTRGTLNNSPNSLTLVGNVPVSVSLLRAQLVSLRVTGSLTLSCTRLSHFMQRFGSFKSVFCDFLKTRKPNVWFVLLISLCVNTTRENKRPVKILIYFSLAVAVSIRIFRGLCTI